MTVASVKVRRDVLDVPLSDCIRHGDLAGSGVISGSVASAERHDPDNFAYIVHAFKLPQRGPSDGRIARFALREVSKLKDAEYVSASLIGNIQTEGGSISHMHTYEQTGVILAPKPEGIVIAQPFDIDTPLGNEWNGFVARHEGKIKSAYVLLTETPEINEILIRTASGVDVVGVFYRYGSFCTSSELEGHARLIQDAVLHVTGHEVPIIPLNVTSDPGIVTSEQSAVLMRNYKEFEE